MLEVLLCSGFPTQLIIGGLLVALGARVSSGAALPFRFVVAVSLLDTLAIVVLVVVFLRLRGEKAGDVLLGRGPLWPEVRRGVAWLPLVFLLVIVLGTAVQTLAPWMHNVRARKCSVRSSSIASSRTSAAHASASCSSASRSASAT
jgi:hypothetical protein